MNLFFDFVNKEKPDLKFNGEEYKVSEKLIKIRLKSLVAQDLFSLNEMYEIFNEDNEILQKAFIILNSHDYDKYGLSQ